MDPIQLRKGFAIKIMVEPQDSEKVDKELDEEGTAPILKKVDGSEAEQAEGESSKEHMAEMLMNGEERETEHMMESGAKPRSLSDRVKMDIMKKKSVTKA